MEGDKFAAYTVGQIMSKPASPSGLDLEGDVGYIVNIATGKRIAKYVTVFVFRSYLTDEAENIAVQITKSFDEEEVLPNEDALCYMHDSKFPCKECAWLEVENYHMYTVVG
jgi:hypothetical protein